MESIFLCSHFGSEGKFIIQNSSFKIVFRDGDNKSRTGGGVFPGELFYHPILSLSSFRISAILSFFN